MYVQSKTSNVEVISLFVQGTVFWEWCRSTGDQKFRTIIIGLMTVIVSTLKLLTDSSSESTSIEFTTDTIKNDYS